MVLAPVHLADTERLHQMLANGRFKVATVTSVRTQLWHEAESVPEAGPT